MDGCVGGFGGDAVLGAGVTGEGVDVAGFECGVEAEEVGDAGGAVDVGGLVGFGRAVRLCDGGCGPGFTGVACVESDSGD